MPKRRTSPLPPPQRIAVQHAIDAAVARVPAGAVGPTGPAGPATTNASLLTSGTLPLGRLVDLTNAELAAAAAIDWTKISKAGSSLADLVTRSAADLGSGTLAKARVHADYPDRTIAEAIAGVWDFSNGLKERGRAAKMGDWTDVAYAAGNFTGSASMTWTVEAADQSVYKYALVAGHTLILSAQLFSTVVGGTLDYELRVAIPGGYTAKAGSGAVSVPFAYHQGAWLFGWAETLASGAYVRLFTAGRGSATWAAGTAHVMFQIELEVN